MFDPSKLNLEIDESKNNKKSEKKAENISSKNIIDSKNQKTDEIEKKEITPQKDEILTQNEDILDSIDIKHEEEIKEVEKKEPKTEEKETVKQKDITETQKKEKTIIYDININSLSDLLFLLVDKEFDFVTIEPTDTEAKLIFRKDKAIVDEKFIKFPIYSRILQKIKVVTKIDLGVSNKPQEWVWTEVLRAKSYKIITKIVSWDFWEKVFLKTSLLENKKVKKVKKKVSLGQIFTFLSIISAIILIVWSSFMSFIIMNAKTVEDVKFFSSLWINLNEINSFIQQTITIIFSILLLIESSFLIIFLFKFFITKKEFKQKKIKFAIASAIFLIITFATFTTWMIIDQKVKNLPNWQEMSYWEIQIYDNAKLKSDKFGKTAALLQTGDTSNLIWPVSIKFDLSFYETNQQSKWYKIQNYAWNFWNKDIVETSLPSIIQNFDTKWNHNINLTVKKIDPQGKIIEEIIKNIPSINISYLVDIDEEILRSWWKKISFDASSLSELWKIQWYNEDNLEEPIWTWEQYIKAEYIYEETLVWMYIAREDKKSEIFDKIFIIEAEDEINIEWNITEVVSPINDLEFDFFVDNVSNDLWNWFIETYKWTIEWKEYTRKWDILNSKDSSKTEHTFSEYWSKIIKVELIDSSWETKELIKEIEIKKVLKLNKKLQIFNDWTIIENLEYDSWMNEYLIKDLWIPTKLKLDARFIKSNDTLYTLQNVEWDYNSDWDIDNIWKIWEYEVNKEWNHTITVNYTFQNYKIHDKTIELSEKIYVEWIKKEAVIDFKINKSSNYVPITIWFDASKSTVKDWNIVKFIWDYWDGISEERDAVVPGHKYIKSGTYDVLLKVITEDWREFEKTKSLVLNKKPQTIDIIASMYKAPIYQWIDFSSDKSEWQIKSFFWDFWDWETSVSANPTHEYNKTWTYTVKLRLDFENKNVLEKTIDIEIYK